MFNDQLLFNITILAAFFHMPRRFSHVQDTTLFLKLDKSTNMFVAQWNFD